MRILAIGVGLLISIVILWFGFRLVQSRFSQASTTVVSEDCTQNADSPSTYTATFDLGQRANTVDVAWGIDPDTLTSRAEPDCTGTSCTVKFDLVPADSTPSYIVLVGGVRVGNGGTSGDNARPFECQASESKASQNNSLPTAGANANPTQALTPTGATNICATIRAQFPSWNPAKCFAAGYTAAQCACMTRDKSSDGR